MKSYITFILIIFSLSLYAQDTAFVDISKYERMIRTNNNPGIVLKLYMDFSAEEFKDFENDNELFDSKNSKLNPKLIIKENKNLILFKEAKIEVSINRKAIQFEITDISEEYIHQLINGYIEAYVQLDKDIVFEAWKKPNVSTYTPLKIKKTQIEKFTKSKPILTDSMAKELIEVKGGTIFLMNNSLDAGFIPADDASSGKTEYFVDFKYLDNYSFIKKTDVFFAAKGHLSTNATDSSNYYEVYPVNYNFIKNRKSEFVGQLGIEGDQSFNTYRVSGNFYWNGLLPNLVNLTFSKDRLRLKPVVKVGLKFYQELENNRIQGINDNEFSNQAFIDLHYNIPIKKRYTLILSGNVFYDFNTSVNLDKEVKYNYNATLGIDIPNSEFKTIVKYAYGENGISYEKNSTLMIGFLLDLVGMDY